MLLILYWCSILQANGDEICFWFCINSMENVLRWINLIYWSSVWYFLVLHCVYMGKNHVHAFVLSYCCLFLFTLFSVSNNLCYFCVFAVRARWACSPLGEQGWSIQQSPRNLQLLQPSILPSSGQGFPPVGRPWWGSWWEWTCWQWHRN